MTLRKKSISSFFWAALEQFGNQTISFVVQIILARILLPEDFGLIGMILIFMAVGKSIIDSGLSQSLIRSKSLDVNDYSTVFYFNISVSVILYLILYLVAPYISTFYEEVLLIEIIRWYALIFIITAFGSIQQTRLVKTLQFKTFFKIALPSILLGGAFGIYLAYNGFGVWSLVASALTQAAINTLLLWIFSNWRPRFIFSIAKFSEHFNFGYKLTLSSLIDATFRNIYSVIIGKNFNATQLGYYNRADTVKQLPVQNIGAILTKVTFPIFAKIQDDDIKLKAAIKLIIRSVTLVLAPLLLISAALGEPLFRLLLTEKWLPAVPYFQILCWAGILYPLNANNLNLLKVKGRSDLFLRLEVIKKSIGVLMIVIALPFGIKALLYTIVFSSIVSFFINSYFTKKLINYGNFEQIKDVLPIVLISALVAYLIFTMDNIVSTYIESDFLRLLVGALVGVMIYFGFVMLFQRNTIKQTTQFFKNV